MKNRKLRVLITGTGSYIGTKFREYAKDIFDISEISVRGNSWQNQSFANYDAILHVAGIAHHSAKKISDSSYYEVNCDLVIEVAKKAKKDGVKQFVFLSSMSVYKEPTSISDEVVITDRTIPNPTTAYGKSKLQAEKGLNKLGSENFRTTIVRPPMVYGPGAKGNFGKLIKLATVCPLFPNIDNRRSAIYIDNLSEFLCQVISKKDSGVFFPQDPQYLNTTMVVKIIRGLRNKRSYEVKLFNNLIAKGSGFSKPLAKLFGTMYYDASSSNYRGNTYRTQNLNTAITATLKHDNIPNTVKKALYTATVDSHILHFHIPYLKLLQEMGYEVHVATNGTAVIPHCDVRHTVSFARSPFKPDNLRAIGQLRKIIDREQFDLIHTHTPMGGVVTRLAAKEARKRGTRVIYTAHGFHFYKGAPWHYWALFYPIEKYLARHTDVLITINQEDYDLAKRKFKTRVEYVPGVGIDPKKFDFPFSVADKLKLRKSLGLKKDDFVMIFPAELSKRKQQMWLVKALAQTLDENPNMHLLLPGKDSLKGKLHQLVEKLELQQNVHLLGYRTDIPQLLKISDLALSSARQEGLPINILEAAIIGLPIIATNCRGNREVGTELLSNNNAPLLIDLVTNYHRNGTDTTNATLNLRAYHLDVVLNNMRAMYSATENVNEA